MPTSLNPPSGRMAPVCDQTSSVTPDWLGNTCPDQLVLIPELEQRAVEAGVEPERRSVLKQLLAGAAALACAPAAAVPQAQSVQRTLRPPGALPQGEFEARCIRCGQCGEACPNRCIQFFGLGNGPSVAYTPYIAPREQACILCMKCGDACPTGAIKPIAREAEAIIAEVKMGRAVVDTSICLSYQGKTCGVCYRACPLQDIAISVQRLEQPVVHDACVGCGLCERACIQMPQAIRILPSASEAKA